mmetsp:Transcript_34972/g.84991  ORF Transcript_34972/g.84991 Transcript_34972/m.84991 type:complete len:220 (-) Transcript_34972:562-1221(-)
MARLAPRRHPPLGERQRERHHHRPGAQRRLPLVRRRAASHARRLHGARGRLARPGGRRLGGWRLSHHPLEPHLRRDDLPRLLPPRQGLWLQGIRRLHLRGAAALRQLHLRQQHRGDRGDDLPRRHRRHRAALRAVRLPPLGVQAGRLGRRGGARGRLGTRLRRLRLHRLLRLLRRCGRRRRHRKPRLHALRLPPRLLVVRRRVLRLRRLHGAVRRVPLR